MIGMYAMVGGQSRGRFNNREQCKGDLHGVCLIASFCQGVDPRDVLPRKMNINQTTVSCHGAYACLRERIISVLVHLQQKHKFILAGA